ncbi:MAG: hypothetical protein KC503_24140 [Myxococcales bacterium]|nr:hypothetical protein [Myxococcales bacterium]
MKAISLTALAFATITFATTAARTASAAPPKRLSRWRVDRRVQSIARFARRRMSDSHWNRVVDVQRARGTVTEQRRGNVTKLSVHDAKRGSTQTLITREPPLLLRVLGLGTTTVRTRQRQLLSDGANSITTHVVSTETSRGSTRRDTTGRFSKHTRDGRHIRDKHDQRYRVLDSGGIQLLAP